MLGNIPKELKTRAYVLRRTNYGEADRILNLITPVGKVSAMAKGVRKPKSKLAGGIEMFSLVNVGLHFGKGDMAVLTGASMVRFYGEILKDLPRMEMGSEILKKVSRAAEMVDSAEFFEIVDKCLAALNDGASVELVGVWFELNLARVMGEEINLYYDRDGDRLDAECLYRWDARERVFCRDDGGGGSGSGFGVVDANVIKILRLIVSSDIEVVARVKNIEKYLPVILEISRN